MDVRVNLHLEGSGSCSNNPLMCPVGNIGIVLKQRCQKVNRSPSNGQQFILRDYTRSVNRFPVIQIPANALTSPMHLFRELMTLNLDHMLCVFLHQHLAQGAFYLSSGGLTGFHLSADVEVVEIEVVEDEIERSERKEASRFVVEMLSRKQRRVLDLDFNKLVKAGDNCAVCLEELIAKEEIKGQTTEKKTQLITMPCHHIFHVSCISRWLEEQNSCPMCRRQIQYEDLVG
ncbi:hypothetical protein CUMW_045860 [Citrus unshiu]|nr:hypothetical protein CUMW_045860 [Citrus unshiu]